MRRSDSLYTLRSQLKSASAPHLRSQRTAAWQAKRTSASFSSLAHSSSRLLISRSTSPLARCVSTSSSRSFLLFVRAEVSERVCAVRVERRADCEWKEGERGSDVERRGDVRVRGEETARLRRSDGGA